MFSLCGKQNIYSAPAYQRNRHAGQHIVLELYIYALLFRTILAHFAAFASKTKSS
jgi:hypothetical protein